MYWSILKLIWHSSSLVRTSICWSITILSVSEQASFSTLQWSSTSERHVVVCCGSFGPLQVFHCSISIPINIWCISLYIYIWNWMMGWESTPLCCKVRPFQNNQVFDMKTKFFGKAYRFGGLWRMQVYILYTYIRDGPAIPIKYWELSEIQYPQDGTS